ncbi:MAG: hypothetical protein ACYC2K_07410 [Gemmatimonadales bacterium]
MTEESSHAFEKGRQWGAFYRKEGREYGKVHGAYPSSPYHASDPRNEDYSAGYEEGFNAQ